MHQLYLYYQQYVTEFGRAPAKVDDFKSYGVERDAPKIYKALEEGRYVFNWNAGASPGASTILCYEKDPGRKGGLIVALMGDGSIRQDMTEEQAQAALGASGR